MMKTLRERAHGTIQRLDGADPVVVSVRDVHDVASGRQGDVVNAKKARVVACPVGVTPDAAAAAACECGHLHVIDCRAQNGGGAYHRRELAGDAYVGIEVLVQTRVVFKIHCVGYFFRRLVGVALHCRAIGGERRDNETASVVLEAEAACDRFIPSGEADLRLTRIGTVSGARWPRGIFRERRAFKRHVVVHRGIVS